MGSKPGVSRHDSTLCGDAASHLTIWILDEALVQFDTYTAELSLVRPDEIALCGRAFERLAALAVYGAEARGIITGTLDRLHTRKPEAKLSKSLGQEPAVFVPSGPCRISTTKSPAISHAGCSLLSGTLVGAYRADARSC
jgi:hypothetical protein